MGIFTITPNFLSLKLVRDDDMSKSCAGGVTSITRPIRRSFEASAVPRHQLQEFFTERTTLAKQTTYPMSCTVVLIKALVFSMLFDRVPYMVSLSFVC